MSSTTLASARQRSGYRPILQPFDHSRRVIILCALVIFALLVTARIIAGSASWVRVELPFDQVLSNGHSAGLDAVTLLIAWVFSPVQGLVIVVLVSLAVLWRSRDWIVFLTFAVVVGGGWLSSELVKIIVHRARPDYHLLANPLSTEVNFASFPSGHTCLATALAVGFILLLRQRRTQKWAIVIGILGVLIVAWSRLYIGAHYPSDVLGSIIYTSSAMVGFLAIWNQWLVQPIERAIAGRRVAHRA